MRHFLEQAIANLDLNLPWILPSLETIESLFPLPLRILAAVALGLYLTRLRHPRPAEQPARS